MRIYNLHARRIAAAASADVGALFAKLGGGDDRLWPKARWPRMRLDRPGEIGARGGHGPIRYHLVELEPQSVRFDFEPRGLAAGLRGWHRFSLEPTDDGTELRHELSAACGPMTLLLWALVIQPLHDALIEDALDCVERQFSKETAIPLRRLGLWVRALRWVLAGSSRAPRTAVAGTRRGDMRQ